jgi:hypothetical protein
MKLEIRASDIKDWFQYRCERRFIYATLPREFRDAVPVDEVDDRNIRGEEGVRFEQDVLRRLREQGESILRPNGGSFHVPPELTVAFLRGEHPARFIYQAKLDETPSLRHDLQLPEHVSIRSGLPDFMEWVGEGAQRRLRIVDVKHTRRPTQYHRAQVAFYALMLRGVFASLGMAEPPIHRQANIWSIGDGGSLWEAEKGLFDLRSHEELLRDFFRRQLGPISQTKIAAGLDQTFFHLYFKCEQCKWLQHCSKTIDDERPREDWDISAIPGLSHQSKAALHHQGLRTLGAVARAAHLGDDTWTLRTRGKLLKHRAEALLSRRWHRLPDHHTWLMPPQIDVPIFLVVDRDPVAAHLVTIGCLVGGKRARPAVVDVVTRATDELPALTRVLRGLIEVLQELHEHNQHLPATEGLRTHIFVYEPSEANDLRDTLATHLDDSDIRSGLIQLVRLFPPEEVRAPEPEYRGAHHLPASALRSVMEQLYVLPAKVSYDLARVSRALAEATPPLNSPYLPGPPFTRPFSARLSIDVMRQLGDKPEWVEATQQDAIARLHAMQSLCQWILDDNAQSGHDFLRLCKPPFRFQEQFHPLEAVDLDVLLAQELLQSRAERLAALIDLARPAEERRERLCCYANLELRDAKSQGGGAILDFFVPPQSRQAEISPGSLGLILTDDDPDLRMDPSRWPECTIELLSGADPSRLRVKIWKKAWVSQTMRRLMQDTPTNGWFLDKGHVDVNTARMETLMRYLSEGEV